MNDYILFGSRKMICAENLSASSGQQTFSPKHCAIVIHILIHCVFQVMVMNLFRFIYMHVSALCALFSFFGVQCAVYYNLDVKRK